MPSNISKFKFGLILALEVILTDRDIQGLVEQLIRLFPDLAALLAAKGLISILLYKLLKKYYFNNIVIELSKNGFAMIGNRRVNQYCL